MKVVKLRSKKSKYLYFALLSNEMSVLKKWFKKNQPTLYQTFENHPTTIRTSTEAGSGKIEEIEKKRITTQ